MALNFTISTVNLNGGTALSLVSDGSTTAVSFDLKSAPFALAFKDNPPSAIVLGNVVDTTTNTLITGVLATIDKDILTLTFPAAPALGDVIQTDFSFVYSSL